MHRRKDSTYYKYDYRKEFLESEGAEVKTAEDFYKAYLKMKARIEEIKD